MEEALLGLASKVALSFVMVFFVFANAFQGVREEPKEILVPPTGIGPVSSA